MILFLNFAPIEFMGGAERWMFNTAKKINKKEKSLLVSVDQSISNIYGKLVLKREFDARERKIDLPYIKITSQALIPFSSERKNIVNQFSNSRIIYARYELQELLLVFYFSGMKGIKKTILGIHSPLIYETPITRLDKIHNFVYGFLSKHVLKRVKKVHVLNQRDKEFLSNKLNLKNVVYIPNGVPEVKNIKLKNSNKLNVLFVGELSERKGADILLEIAKKIPQNINLTIAGDGAMSKQFKSISRKSNVNYLGYVDKNKLSKIYESNDIFLLPSRAESMPLAVLEALSHGLFIVDSSNIKLGLGDSIEYSVKRFEADDYIAVINLIFKTNSINKKKSINFFKRNFTERKIDQKLQSAIFNL